MKENQLIQLVEEMIIDEKINQLLQLAVAFYSDKAEEETGPMSELGLSQETTDTARTTLGVSGANEAKRVQKEYMQNHRLNTPALSMADIIHGFRTIFPIPLTLGSTWDEAAVEKMAEISVKEATVLGLYVIFSPMVDLVRDSRRGRVMEPTGEDPLLNSRLVAVVARGYQGENLKEDNQRVAVCVKHLATYGGALVGWDYNTVDMSERQLREIYLLGHKAGLDAGAKLVMASFNTVDGISATGNRQPLRDVLRNEFGSEGVMISDWGAIKELIPHDVAKDEKQVAELAIRVGVNIEMMTTYYPDYLKELLEEGRVAETLIDEAAMRVSKPENELGLFESPYHGVDEQTEVEVILSKEHREIAKEIA